MQPIDPEQVVKAARQILIEELDRRKMTYARIESSSLDFAQLAPDKKILFTLRGCDSDPQWKEMKQFAHENGFVIETH